MMGTLPSEPIPSSRTPTSPSSSSSSSASFYSSSPSDWTLLTNFEVYESILRSHIFLSKCVIARARRKAMTSRQNATTTTTIPKSSSCSTVTSSRHSTDKTAFQFPPELSKPLIESFPTQPSSCSSSGTFSLEFLSSFYSSFIPVDSITTTTPTTSSTSCFGSGVGRLSIPPLSAGFAKENPVLSSALPHSFSFNFAASLAPENLQDTTSASLLRSLHVELTATTLDKEIITPQKKDGAKKGKSNTEPISIQQPAGLLDGNETGQQTAIQRRRRRIADSTKHLDQVEIEEADLFLSHFTPDYLKDYDRFAWLDYSAEEQWMNANLLHFFETSNRAIHLYAQKNYGRALLLDHYVRTPNAAADIPSPCTILPLHALSREARKFASILPVPSFSPSPTTPHDISSSGCSSSDSGTISTSSACSQLSSPLPPSFLSEIDLLNLLNCAPSGGTTTPAAFYACCPGCEYRFGPERVTEIQHLISQYFYSDH